jgi:hypothetical protein
MVFWIIQILLFSGWFILNLYLSYTHFRLKTDTPRILRNRLNELLLYLINFALPLIAGVLIYAYQNLLFAGVTVAFYVLVWKVNMARGYRSAFQTCRRLHICDLKERGVLDQFTEEEIDETVRRMLEEDKS